MRYMYLLSGKESETWRDLCSMTFEINSLPSFILHKININLLPAFFFFIGFLQAVKGNVEQSKKWLLKGCRREVTCGNRILLDFIKRHNTAKIKEPKNIKFELFRLKNKIPEVISAHRNFVQYSYRCLPPFDHPVKIISVGCGDGKLLRRFIYHLLDKEKAYKIDEILLVDPSVDMTDMAKKNILSKFKNVKLKVINKKIEEAADDIKSVYDIAFCHSSLHNLSYEDKINQIKKMKGYVNNFLLFEEMANFSSPEPYSPELSLAIYLLYGSKSKIFLKRKMPAGIKREYIDSVLIPDMTAVFTGNQARAKKHYLLRHQWHGIFASTLGDDFRCLCDSVCYADKFTEFGFICYGR